MVEFNLNNLVGNRGAQQTTPANFDSLLNFARGQLDKISQEVQNFINQQVFNNKAVTQESGGFKVQIPQLSNFITGQQDVLLKTAFPLDKTQNFNIQVQSSNVVLEQGKPILQLQGQITPNNAQGTPQRFTAEIPISNLETTPNQNSLANQILNSNDQVVRNFLPSNQIQAFTNNLTENLRPLLPQNLQNINLTAQNNLNINITSFTDPSGKQIILQQNPNTQIIQGRLEIFPEAKEALIRTDFGTFRISQFGNLPNGSNISFTIENQAVPERSTNNLLNLNPTNIQTLRLSLEATDSPLQNLLRLLNSTQGFSHIVQRFFPHPDDKAAYVRQLLFLSGAVQGSPEGWLGDEGQLLINKLHESDTNLNRLSEVFGVLRNFAGKGEQTLNLEWNSYIIPFYDGNKLSFVTVQVQKDPEGTNQQNSKGKRKFILELEQDELGRVAIEGLYSKAEGKVKDLDIVLKTDNELSKESINELNALFNEIAMAYGFTGGINFAPFNAISPLYADVSKILGDGIVI